MHADLTGCRPRLDAPTPRRWVEAAISHIGYESTQTPYWCAVAALLGHRKRLCTPQNAPPGAKHGLPDLSLSWDSPGATACPRQPLARAP